MKEYEYITLGIENFLVDELVGVICQESIESKSYPDGFRRIFDNYKELRDEYRKKYLESNISTSQDLDLNLSITDFENKREAYYEAFLVEVEINYPDLDVRKIAADYFTSICADDVLTTEKRVCIYPYIILKARQNDERKNKNGYNN